jgi:hypothetical protein
VQYVHNSWTSSTTKKTPFNLLMGYTPRLHVSTSPSHLPEAASQRDQLLMARTTALTAIRNAQQMLLKHTLRKKGQHHFHPLVTVTVLQLGPQCSGRPTRTLSTSSRSSSSCNSNTSSSSASQSTFQAVAPDTPDWWTAWVLAACRATQQEQHDKSAFPARLAEVLQRHGMAVWAGCTSTHVMQGITNELARLQHV